jgi:hypothetical protein
VIISFNGIKNGCLDYYKVASNQIGQLAKYTVKWISESPKYFQNKQVAFGAVVLANFVFFEIARLVCIVFDKCLNHYLVPFDQLPEGTAARSWRILQLFGVGSLTITGCNYALYRGLQLPFTPLLMTAISLASCAFYTLVKTRCLSRH